MRPRDCSACRLVIFAGFTAPDGFPNLSALAFESAALGKKSSSLRSNAAPPPSRSLPAQHGPKNEKARSRANASRVKRKSPM